MQVTVDLGAAFSGTIEPIKPGRYVASVREVRQSNTQEGATKLGVCLRVEHGDFAGRLLWTNIVLAPTALPRLRAFLRAIGEQAEGTVTLDTLKWVGRKLTVKVGVELVGDKKRNVIYKFLPTAAVRAQASPKSQAAEEQPRSRLPTATQNTEGPTAATQDAADTQ